MTFLPHPSASERRGSARLLIKMLLKIDKAEVLAKHINECIDKMLWKITEADGKHNTRYRGEGAIGVTSTNRLRHEHVFQKKTMISALRKANSEQVIDDILDKAIGCVVTIDEHDRLEHLKDQDGWDRYTKAGIRVKDLVNGSWVT